MKIKEQTRKVAAGCSKHCFEVVDRTDEVSNHTYDKATLTWFEEIFEEYKSLHNKTHITKVSKLDNMRFSDFKDFLFNVGSLISKGDNSLLQLISTESAELFNLLIDGF